MAENEITISLMSIFTLFWVVGITLLNKWQSKLKDKQDEQLKVHTEQMIPELEKWLSVNININKKLIPEIINKPIVLNNQKADWTEQHLRSKYDFYNHWQKAIDLHLALQTHIKDRTKLLDSVFTKVINAQFPKLIISDNCEKIDTIDLSVISSRLKIYISTVVNYPETNLKPEVKRGTGTRHNDPQTYICPKLYGIDMAYCTKTVDTDSEKKWETLIDNCVKEGLKTLEEIKIREDLKNIESELKSFTDGLKNLLNNLETTLIIEGKCDSKVHNWW